MKEENYIVMARDAGKALHKILHQFLISIPSKLEREGISSI